MGNCNKNLEKMNNNKLKAGFTQQKGSYYER